MSTRARLARLERLKRLERASRPDHACPTFVIAPELARAIVDDYERLKGLLGRARWLAISPVFAQITPKLDPAAEEQVAARLAEHLRDVRCPPDYWANRADADRKDIERFFSGSEPLASCDEAVQLRARLIVFGGSPEGAAWRTMMELHYRKRTRAEQAELDQLHRRYPGMPLKSYHPFYESDRAMFEVLDGARRKFEGLPQSTRPAEHDWYGTENALWRRVDQYR
jgi:hypothetical protein